MDMPGVAEHSTLVDSSLNSTSKFEKREQCHNDWQSSDSSSELSALQLPTSKVQNNTSKSSKLRNVETAPVPSDASHKDEIIFMGLKRGNVQRSHITDKEIANLIVKCTACAKQINHHNSSRVRRHLHLGVLICRECFDFYDSGEFTQDSTGDIYCRWCAQGGKLAACDFCSNAFCHKCVRYNFGRGEIRRVQDVKWHCYVCNPQPLTGMVAYCSMILDYSRRMSSTRRINELPPTKNDYSDYRKRELVLKQIVKTEASANCLRVKAASLREKFDQCNPELVSQCNSLLTSFLNSQIQQLRKILTILKGTDSKLEVHQRNRIQINKTSERQQHSTKNGVEEFTLDSDSDESSDLSEQKDKDFSVNFEDDVSSDGNSDKSAKSKLENISTELNEIRTEVKAENTKEDDTPFSQSLISNLPNKELISNNTQGNISSTNNGTLSVCKKEPVGSESACEENQELVFTSADNVLQNAVKTNPLNVFKKEIKNKIVRKLSAEMEHKPVESIQEKNKRKKSIVTKKKLIKTDRKKRSSESSTASFEDCFVKQMEEVQDNDKCLLHKEKDENEKAKELLLKTSSDSETEPFNLDLPSLNKDNFNNDSTTEISSSDSESSSSRASSHCEKQSLSNYDDHKLQMNVKVCVEKVDDRTLDDTIEELPLDDDQQNISVVTNGSQKNEKNKQPRNSDEDIDKEIDNLAKLTMFCTTKKKQRLCSDSDSEADNENKSEGASGTGTDDRENANDEKDNIKASKIKSREIIISDSDSDSDSMEEHKAEVTDSKLADGCASKTQNEIMKELLLSEIASDESDKTTASESDDIPNDENEKAKKKVHKENSNTENKKTESNMSDAADSEDSIDEFLLKKKRTYHKLLAIPLSDDDSKEKSSKTSDVDAKRKQNKRKLLEDGKKKAANTSDTASTTSDSEFAKKNSESLSYKKVPKKRRRIKQMSQSSSNESDDDVQVLSESQDKGESPGSGKGRKNIRKVISDKKLRDETKAAAQAEKERKRRIAERQKAYNHTVVEVTETGERVTTKLILEVDEESKEELVQVHPDLIVKLKPHQVEGVKFMWEGTIESFKQLNSSGTGCILAHCMGLGKTLQVIAYTHTLLTTKCTSKHIKTCLIVCPYNTILNWAQEYDSWLDTDELKLKVFEMSSVKDYNRRASCLEEWQEGGGIMIMSYDMFRLLVQENSKRIPKRLKAVFASTLLDPGPDIVVCDEGHVLKNESSAISKATERIRTRRRVVLTGTPLQNNLSEYHCMVQFVKPHLLGTRKEFLNRFVNPISNGQCADSTPQDVKFMKKRVHILHKLLEGCVQRCDYSSLTTVLPPRHEYVISLRLSDVQIKLYQYFLENLTRARGGTLGTQLFRDCCILQLICTHPFTLHMDHIRKSNKNFVVDYSDSESGGSFIDDRSESELEAEARGDKPRPSTSKDRTEKSEDSIDEELSDEEVGKRRHREEKEKHGEWWSQFVNEDDGTKIELSGKMVLFFDLLKQCEAIGDKVLLFSQNLLTLDLVEELLSTISDQTTNNSDINNQDVSCTWIHGIDYFRMDGSTNADLRKRWIEIFNDEENSRARLFMISKKAGGLGTNLVGANRVIIMDASWNPSHDVQAIFRVYRFGQKKPVYIYRLLAQGTMEEKIYDRQVTKQSLSCRVVDEQQIERHFNSADLAELYTFNPESKSKRPTPMLPKDRLLAEMLIRNKDWIVTYHEHDSLLQNISEEDLTEEERQAAWVEYEAEREGIVQNNNTAGWNVLDPIIQCQPVPTPDQSPETYGPLPDARTDITKVVENLKMRRPNMAPNEMNAALLSALVMLRAHYQQCHVIAVRQKQDYMAKNQIAPPQLNEYLSALNVSIQQLTQVLQSIRTQQSLIHQAQQAAAGVRFQNPAWNRTNQTNRTNQGPQTQAFKITVTRGPAPPGQSQSNGTNSSTSVPPRPTTINIQVLGNNRVPLISGNQRFPVDPSAFARSLRGNSIRFGGNNIVFNNNRTAFHVNTPSTGTSTRFNGVTITPVPTTHSQINQVQQHHDQEPIITEVEDIEHPAPTVRPHNYPSSVTITELD